MIPMVPWLDHIKSLFWIIILQIIAGKILRVWWLNPRYIHQTMEDPTSLGKCSKLVDVNHVGSWNINRHWNCLGQTCLPRRTLSLSLSVTYIYIYIIISGSGSKTHARLLVSEWHLQIWIWIFAAVAKDRPRAAKGSRKVWIYLLD
jgi:hypothetical protein